MEYDLFVAYTISKMLGSIGALYASVEAICQIVSVRSNLWECGTGLFAESTLCVSLSIPITHSLCHSP